MRMHDISLVKQITLTLIITSYFTRPGFKLSYKQRGHTCLEVTLTSESTVVENVLAIESNYALDSVAAV